MSDLIFDFNLKKKKKQENGRCVLCSMLYFDYFIEQQHTAICPNLSSHKIKNN